MGKVQAEIISAVPIIITLAFIGFAYTWLYPWIQEKWEEIGVERATKHRCYNSNDNFHNFCKLFLFSASDIIGIGLINYTIKRIVGLTTDGDIKFGQIIVRVW